MLSSTSLSMRIDTTICSHEVLIHVTVTHVTMSHMSAYHVIGDPTETVTNQHPGFLVSLFSSLGIKYTLELLQTNLGVGVPGFRAGIVLSRGGERGPVASMGSSWPDNYWYQRPTVYTNTLDSGNSRALDDRASIVLWIILT